jgi:hypothetical protein
VALSISADIINYTQHNNALPLCQVSHFFTVMLSVVMLNVILLGVFMLSDITPILTGTIVFMLDIQKNSQDILTIIL